MLYDGIIGYVLDVFFGLFGVIFAIFVIELELFFLVYLGLFLQFLLLDPDYLVLLFYCNVLYYFS